MPKTGPVTVAGKRKSCINIVRSGIQCKGILPCKKERCYFFLNGLCDFISEYGQEAFGGIEYGTEWPTKMEMYITLAYAYTSEVQNTDNNTLELLHEHILVDIRQTRRQRLSAIEADIASDVHRSNYGGLALS